jgi:hypothetical protein
VAAGLVLCSHTQPLVSWSRSARTVSPLNSRWSSLAASSFEQMQSRSDGTRIPLLAFPGELDAHRLTILRHTGAVDLKRPWCFQGIFKRSLGANICAFGLKVLLCNFFLQSSFRW